MEADRTLVCGNANLLTAYIRTIPKYAFLKLMDGILGQSSSPHKKHQYLKITVTLNFKYPLKCINSIKHLDAGTQFSVFAVI